MTGRPLTETYPDYADQLVTPPGAITATSQQPRDWQCETGHVWTERVRSRTQRGGGCLVCEGRQLLAGVSDIATTHPEIAVEAEGWDPTTETWAATRKRAWRCPDCENRYVTTTRRRTAGERCPTCTYGGDPTSNILSARRPDLAAEAHGWDPSTAKVGNHTLREWRCALGHTWEAATVHRVSHGTGCPVCAGRAVLPGFNDLATTHPKVAAEANGWDPSTVTAGAAAELTWTCPRGHTWTQSPSQRTWMTAPAGCPVCAGKTVLPGFNDLATTHPHLAAEANGWDPTTVINASGKHLPWKCARGHEWDATIAVRKSTKGCPYCTGARPIPGETDLATTHPEIAAELIGLDPTALLPGSFAIGTWECAHGHVWQDRVATRTKSSATCPECP